MTTKRLMHHGEMIRDAGHCASVGCHLLAEWKVVYTDKSYEYLCSLHATGEAEKARRGKRAKAL